MTTLIKPPARGNDEVRLPDWRDQPARHLQKRFRLSMPRARVVAEHHYKQGDQR